MARIRELQTGGRAFIHVGQLYLVRRGPGGAVFADLPPFYTQSNDLQWGALEIIRNRRTDHHTPVFVVRLHAGTKVINSTGPLDHPPHFCRVSFIDHRGQRHHDLPREYWG